MRIIIIIDNNDFFLPKHIDKFLKKTKNSVIEVGIVKKVPIAASMNYFIIKNLNNFSLKEIYKLFLSKIKKIIFKFIKFEYKKKDNLSISEVLKKRKIPFFYVYYKFNEKDLLKKIKNQKIDFIISLNSLMFSKAILNSPKYSCINRHTSLLPKNKGLLPVFHSLKDNDKKFGISFHVMTAKIDNGKILVQKEIKIKKNQSVMELYERSFTDTESLIDQSIHNYINNIYIKSNYKNTYNSWPNQKDWKKFRKNKKIFI